MLVRGDELITATGLFGEAVRHCEMLEETGACLAAGVNIGNPFTDVPHLRSNVVVTTDSHPQRARREALRLARFMWRHRADMQADLTPLPEAIRLAEETEGLTVFSDAADSTASGRQGTATPSSGGCSSTAIRSAPWFPSSTPLPSPWPRRPVSAQP